MKLEKKKEKRDEEFLSISPPEWKEYPPKEQTERRRKAYPSANADIVSELKDVTVVDRNTKAHFLIGHLFKDVEGWVRNSWIVIKPERNPKVMMGGFDFPPGDIRDSGNMPINRTTMLLAHELNDMKELFQEKGIPETIDLTGEENPYE